MTARDPRALQSLQLELECKGLTEDDQLVRIPGDEPDDIELVQVTRDLSGSHRILVRHDAGPELIAGLRHLSPEAAFDRPSLVAEALGDPETKFERGRSYVFPDELSAPPDVSRVMPAVTGPEASEPWTRRPMFVVFVNGEQASYCRSSRENHRAAEAWVETQPQFQGRGLARAVVVAWATDVLAAGKVAFYSHRDDNVASAGVARSLGLLWWLSYVNFETD